MRHLLTVIAILLAFACCTTEADRNRMRAELDSINQRNRNDQPFTAADVQPYVNFFDDHGTPNDRLLAHYLLGRAYLDLHRATARERYELLLRRCPGIVHHLALQDLASFLCVTPNYLSTIRKDITFEAKK